MQTHLVAALHVIKKLMPSNLEFNLLGGKLNEYPIVLTWPLITLNAHLTELHPAEYKYSQI